MSQKYVKHALEVPAAGSHNLLMCRHIRRFCAVDTAGHRLLENAVDRLGLSARAYNRVLKIARTIADLEGVDGIDANHIGEAIQ